MKFWLVSFCWLLSACNTIGPLHKFSEVGLDQQASQKLHDFLSASEPNRAENSPGLASSFKFLKTEFEKVAAQINKTKGKARVIVHEFEPDTEFAARNYQNDFDTLIKAHYPPTDATYKKWQRFTLSAIKNVRRYQNKRGKNLILEITGKKEPNQVIYVGAHYDTIIHDHATLEILPQAPAPGADDNGSGVSSLLVLAEELAKQRPDRTVRFVAFDFEEIFFLGSYALAKDLSSQRPRWMITGEQTVGLIDLEMLGYSTKKPEHPVLKIYARDRKDLESGADTSLAGYFPQAARLLKSPLDIQLVQNGFNRSDNWSFWQKSFPAICVSEDWEHDFNPQYHSSADTADQLNFHYLGLVDTLLVEAVTEMAHVSQHF